MRRILFCSHNPLDPKLGMSKHSLELRSSMATLGWRAEIAGPEEIAGGPTQGRPESFPPVLRDFLRRNAAGYDVVEYDHAFLPYPRSDFPKGPLFVARCMLLHHHFLKCRMPAMPGILRRLKRPFSERRVNGWMRWVVAQADETVRHADLTAVSNHRDAAALIEHGADPGRIAVLPPGLSAERIRQLAAVSAFDQARPVVGFIGTFEPRKGMVEFPRLVDRLAREVSGVRFRLLGTAGLVPDARGVLAYFPSRLRSIIDVTPRYEPEDLPGLLRGVSVGIFPSRIEGFGYGVLEMLAASIPVIAYDAPGPNEILDPGSLVDVADLEGLVGKVRDLLVDPLKLRAARRQAGLRAADFSWERISSMTQEVYSSRIPAELPG